MKNATGVLATGIVMMACGSGATVFSNNGFIKAAGVGPFGLGAISGLMARDVRQAQERSEDFLAGATQPKLAGSPPPNPKGP